MTCADIARLYYEFMVMYSTHFHEEPKEPWDKLPEEEQQSILDMVRQGIEAPNYNPKDQHDAWVAYRNSVGWVWGKEFNGLKKQDPLLKEYDKLPDMFKFKEATLETIVNSLRKHV